MITLTPDEAIARLVDFTDESGRRIVYTRTASLIGGDWPRTEVEALIRECGGAYLSGPTAVGLGCGIYVICPERMGGGPLFLQTAGQDAT